MILEMLRWWYSTGWVQAVHKIEAWPASVTNAFSFSLLLRTLFAPWRRIITVAGRSLEERTHAALDNLVSRFVGFFIRFTVLIAATTALILTIVAALIFIILWPLLPLLVIFFIIKGISG